MSESVTRINGARLDSAVERKFNHDLLIDKSDQEFALQKWPAIARILIEPDVIENFLPHEEAAKRLKRAVQILGSIAVLLTLAALVGETIDLWKERGNTENLWVDCLPAIAAIIGLTCAVLASRIGPLRRRWLKHRFITEVLRQWHFRSLLDGASIDQTLGISCDSHVAKRESKWAVLLHDLKSVVGQKMDQLVADTIDPLGSIPRPKLPTDSNARTEMLDAYRKLRIDHQREFAIFKLGFDDRTFLGLPLRVLVWITDLLAGVTLLLAPLIACVRMFDPKISWIPFTTVCLAIVGVAVRAWRDGFALGEESERYQEMLHRMQLLTARWEADHDDDSRFLIAEEVEEAGLEELRSFVRSHESAQFLF